MNRLRHFVMFQRAAIRALFRRAPKAIEVFMDFGAAPAVISHPAQLCRCFGQRLADPAYDVLADHNPGCLWVAAMCEGCAGTGWCVKCGGDGTRPDWDPDKTAPGRPSAMRIA